MKLYEGVAGVALVLALTALIVILITSSIAGSGIEKRRQEILQIQEALGELQAELGQIPAPIAGPGDAAGINVYLSPELGKRLENMQATLDSMELEIRKLKQQVDELYQELKGR